MLKKISITAGVLFLALGAFIFDLASDGGAFKEIEPHFNGQCSIVEGVVGAEDITIDQASGVAYISAHDRRTWVQDSSYGGTIYTYQMDNPDTPVAMTHDLGTTLFPHGVSLWKNPNGADRLFVVNHPAGLIDGEEKTLSQVIIFEIEGNHLKHIQTLDTDAPYSLNDVAAASSDSFYASIDVGSLTSFGRTLEQYGRLARGGIAYGDSAGITKAYDGLVYPNGVQISADGKTVFVAETTGERMIAFSRDTATNTLSLMAETRIDSGLDNLEWDTEGNLWIGAHPQAIKFPAHRGDSAARSPSQILKTRYTGEGFEVEEIYLNDGDPLSGSSVGAPYKNRFLVGAVFEPFILDCAISQ